MKYNVRVFFKNHARVFNFEIENSNVSTNTLLSMLSSVVKEGYDVALSIGYKRHRGEALSFFEVINKLKDVRFFEYKTIQEWVEREEKVEICTLDLPYCYIERDNVNWGVFFNIVTPAQVHIKPDMSKVKELFESKGIDVCQAVNGKYYTHNQIEFVKIPGVFSWKWKVYKINTIREIKKTRNMVEL